VTVQQQKSPEDAPVVKPDPTAGADVMRTAFKTTYNLLVNDWKGAMTASKNLTKAAPNDLDGDVLSTVKKAVTDYKNAVHNAFRLLYAVRVLQLRAAYAKGVDSHADAVSELFAAEGVGTAGAVDGDVSGVGGVDKPFDSAKQALSRLAQNGERFFNASADI